MQPPAAARLVFMKTTATALAQSTEAVASTEPPLKPNQPNHRIKVPNVRKGKLAPGIAFTSPFGPYFPCEHPPDDARQGGCRAAM